MPPSGILAVYTSIQIMHGHNLVTSCWPSMVSHNFFSLPGLWDAGRTSARPGSGGRGGSGALIWAGWASPQWAPPPAPSAWPGGAPPPARHAVYLQAIAYFSDSARPEWWSGRKEEERCVGEIEVERGDEDRGFISAWGEIVRQGRAFGYLYIEIPLCNSML